MKTDIRQYTDRELTLIVSNDEYLYNLGNCKALLANLADNYIYTKAQMIELINDLDNK